MKNAVVLDFEQLDMVIGGEKATSENTLQQGPWGKAWGEGGWGSCGPNSDESHKI